MEPRTIRVFISSTFRDMNPERDYLNNIIFPQIEQYCKRRFLSFIPIDLRWGIPEKYSRNGLVLSTCMEEIDKSRPFFIGILGSRYGWNPKSSELTGLRGSERQKKWILDMAADGASITEMEIEYGVLQEMDMPYASFFIRSDKMVVPQEYKEAQGSKAEERLKKLKQRIRNQYKYPVSEYDSVQQLGEMILRQLIIMIETEYPQRSNDKADSMVEIQERTLDRRSMTLFDLSGTLSQVNRWISDHGRLLLISGDPGSGTSTTMAYCVSELRNKFKNKILYFDFESLDVEVNPLEALYLFLSMKENIIPNDEWGLVAIDNTSILSTEDEKGLVKWLDGLGKNVAVVMTITTDCNLWETIKYNTNCSSISINGMTPDMKRQFIENYANRYSKGRSTEQLDGFANKIKSSNIGVIENLMRLLIRYGSMEQLDERITALANNSDEHIVFSLIYHEAINTFKEIELDGAYYDMVLCISLVANGVPEKDLLGFVGLSQAQWSVVRPSVMLFCSDNANCLRYSISSWQVAMRDCCHSTFDRALVGMRMIKWYLSDPAKWNRCARIVNDIYQEVWPWESELENLEELMFAFAKSPDMIRQLKDSALGELWSHISKNMSDSPVRVYGKPVENLSAEEAIAYYMRLAKTAKSLRRGMDVSYCYAEISKIKEKEEKVDADFYRYRSTLEIGRPDMTVFFVDRSGILQGERRGWLTGKLKVKYSLEQQLLAHLVMVEAFILKGDYNNAGIELQCFRDKAKNYLNCATGFLRDVIVTGYSYFAYVLSGFYPLSNVKIAKELLMIIFENPLKMGLEYDATYFKFMAGTCLEYWEKSYERMLNAASWALNSARLAYGVNSYQYARAHLMYAHAHYHLDGNYGLRNNAFKNVYQALDYSRSFENRLNRNIDWNKIEIGVKNTLFQEFDFFWNIERSIQPVTEVQKNMEKKKENYRKSIGL